ncbi:MAG: hypothetical protein WCH11_07460, partial [Bdellovibrio sp.]
MFMLDLLFLGLFRALAKISTETLVEFLLFRHKKQRRVLAFDPLKYLQEWVRPKGFVIRSWNFECSYNLITWEDCMLKRWSCFALGFLTAGTLVAADPTHDRDLYKKVPSKSREGVFQPQFFSVGRNLEVVEQGPRSVQWSSQILLENNEFQSLLAEGRLQWTDIRALHLSGLRFRISEAQASIGAGGEKIIKIPSFFSIGLEVVSPAPGQRLRVTMEVQALVTVNE